MLNQMPCTPDANMQQMDDTTPDMEVDYPTDSTPDRTSDVNMEEFLDTRVMALPEVHTQSVSLTSKSVGLHIMN